MIEVLRLGHRILRDKRTSTHVALTARAFGASKIYYSGQNDKDMEISINKVVEKFGGPFEVEHVKNYINLIKQKKKEGFKICHLTMYGEKFLEHKNELKGNLLVIVGGEKVEGVIYDLSDFNLGISNEPISEVSALGIFLYEINGFADLKNGKLKVIPQKKGKLLKELN